MINVYISIGNSSNKLKQAEWADFYRQVDSFLISSGVKFHGKWMSSPVSQYQNACWSIDIIDTEAERTQLKDGLSDLAREFRQNGIMWAEAPVVLLVG